MKNGITKMDAAPMEQPEAAGGVSCPNCGAKIKLVAEESAPEPAESGEMGMSGASDILDTAINKRMR